MSSDTIYALASGGLPSGVAIVRVSGPQAHDVARALAGRLPNPKSHTLTTLRHEDRILDTGLVLRFDAPDSFTGEDVVEFQVHGSKAGIAAVLDAISDQPGTRAAEAGEFSRRAFANGRMDLTQIEGLSDLIAAETEAQRRLAVAQAGGVMSRKLEDWRTRIVRARAMIEANFDFTDEEDVPDDVSAPAWASVAALSDEIGVALREPLAGQIIREGFRVVLAGPPNVGKSSLLNALAKRDVAIVTDQAGTTRDRLDVSIDLEGYKVILTDTAGQRETDDVVEQEGVRRAQAAMRDAQLVLWMDPDPSVEIPVGSERLVSKSDAAPHPDHLSVSVQRPDGLDALLGYLVTRIVPDATSADLMTRTRHREGLQRTHEFLEYALDPHTPAEAQADFLRQAADALGRITGRIGVEELLGVIFSEFCVGK